MTLYDQVDQNPKITMRRDIHLILSNSSYLVENGFRCHSSYDKVIREIQNSDTSSCKKVQ